VRHETDRRLGDAHQMSDLALMIRAHLDDGETMLRGEAQQRERHADVSVEIAARRERRADARENRSDHFLRRRLAVAPRDANDGDRKPTPPLAREGRQGGESIRYRDLRNADRHRTPDHNPYG